MKMKKFLTFALCAAILGAYAAPTGAAEAVANSGAKTVKAENDVTGKKAKKKKKKSHKKKKSKSASKGHRAKKV